jgi:hypothetical protein
MSESPDFVGLSRIEEDLLAAKLQAIRASITHAPEKGRALEHAVTTLLRGFLPAEYGLSTGFVVWLSPDGPKLSRQLDIIIYDAIKSGPLIRLSTCDVFPLEAVYGYVEVKATLCSTGDEAAEPAQDSIEACVARNLEIRRMDIRHYRVPLEGSPPSSELSAKQWRSLRSYVVAFEPVGTVAKNLKTFAGRLAAVLKRTGVPAHLHGVFIPNHGLLYTRPVSAADAADDDYFHVRYTADHPLLTFKTLLHEHLATFERPPSAWPPAIDEYFKYIVRWNEETP